MKETSYRQYSRILNREMEHVVFGESGRVCFAFPSQNGHVYDFKNFGMIDSVRPWIEAGKLQIVCVDSIDEESWSNEQGDPRERIELQEHWFHYLTDELVPQLLQNGEKGMVTGCSMGGVHSGIAFFRRPDLFDTMISLSGLFDAGYFFHGYMDDLVYANSPIHFLPNMPQDHPWIDLYNRGNIILCVGQGAWEDQMRHDAAVMDRILNEKGVRHWTDFWGYDVNHDWPWWRKQLPYFIGILLGAA